MDKILSPYAPGAGTPPRELVGRDKLRDDVRVALERIRLRRPSKSVLLVGLRGVGKTVLLQRMMQDAELAGLRCVRIEAPEDRSLPALIGPQLRLALLQMSRLAKAKDAAEKGLRALAGFAKALKIKYADIEVGFDFEPEPGLADNGDLQGDLMALLEQAGKAALAAETALVIFIDELQYIPQDQFAALITSLHRCFQLQLPLTVVGAGLPQLRALAGEAKSYAERLFDYPEVGRLSQEEAELAIVAPAEEAGASYEQRAVEEIFRRTQGYPYFLQEWGKHCWEIATQSPITFADVELASKTAIAALDASFFRVRFDRLSPKERDYLRAMAEGGRGPHRSGDIAEQMHRKVSSLSPMRSRLIAKGMLFSPAHGDTAFTVPLFDEFMKRIMPGNDWRKAH